jgi:hypothetical protein
MGLLYLALVLYINLHFDALDIGLRCGPKHVEECEVDALTTS